MGGKSPDIQTEPRAIRSVRCDSSPRVMTMSDFALRVSAGDLLAYLDTQGSCLGVLRLVNLAPGKGDWLFRATQDRTGSLDLALTVSPNPVDPMILLSWIAGLVPEALLCRQIALSPLVSPIVGLRELGRDSDLESVTSLPMSVEPLGLNTTLIRLEGYWSDSLDADMVDQTAVLGFLEHNTWLGSTRYANSPRRLRWEVLGDSSLGRAAP